MENFNEIEKKIQSLLFFKAEPVNIDQIAEYTKIDREEIIKAIESLSLKLSSSALVVVKNGDHVVLGTHPEMSNFIETVSKEEMSKELSKASVETLAIILYKGPISRRDIDYIRGVNSQFILRNLLIRGLIEKSESKEDLRSYSYKPSIDLLRYLGVSSIESLPEFESIKKQIESFEAEAENDENVS